MNILKQKLCHLLLCVVWLSSCRSPRHFVGIDHGRIRIQVLFLQAGINHCEDYKNLVFNEDVKQACLRYIDELPQKIDVLLVEQQNIVEDYYSEKAKIATAKARMEGLQKLRRALPGLRAYYESRPAVVKRSWHPISDSDSADNEDWNAFAQSEILFASEES